MNDKPALISVRDTAERLNVSLRTVYRLAESGELPALRVGGSIRFDVDELNHYLYSTEGASE